MTSLTAKQRAHLKSLAHPLKPVVQVGKEGVTDRVVQSVSEAFATRELLKVKLLDSAPAGVRDVAAELSARIDGAAVVQVIGRTIVLFRPDPAQPVNTPPRTVP